MLSHRVATPADAEAVTATISSSFAQDPVWAWIFADDALRPAQYTAWWGMFVEGAQRFPWIRVTEHCESVALWIPPGEDEVTAELEAVMDEQVAQLPAADVARAHTMFGRFEAARPTEPHFYLSLFGTHQDHRGHGLGMRLLADNLAEIDALHQPAYLESTNDANLNRYASVGFERLGAFAAGDPGPMVTTMWRPARS